MKKNARIYVAGHHGLGLAIVRRLCQAGYGNLLLKTCAELDITDQQATADFFAAGYEVKSLGREHMKRLKEEVAEK